MGPLTLRSGFALSLWAFRKATKPFQAAFGRRGSSHFNVSGWQAHYGRFSKGTLGQSHPFVWLTCGFCLYFISSLRGRMVGNDLECGQQVCRPCSHKLSKGQTESLLNVSFHHNYSLVLGKPDRIPEFSSTTVSFGTSVSQPVHAVQELNLQAPAHRSNTVVRYPWYLKQKLHGWRGIFSIRQSLGVIFPDSSDLCWWWHDNHGFQIQGHWSQKQRHGITINRS